MSSKHATLTSPHPKPAHTPREWPPKIALFPGYHNIFSQFIPIISRVFPSIISNERLSLLLPLGRRWAPNQDQDAARRAPSTVPAPVDSPFSASGPPRRPVPGTIASRPNLIRSRRVAPSPNQSAKRRDASAPQCARWPAVDVQSWPCSSLDRGILLNRSRRLQAPPRRVGGVSSSADHPAGGG